LAISEGGIKIFLGVKRGKPYAEERKLLAELREELKKDLDSTQIEVLLRDSLYGMDRGL
jgi:hypothetical protein